MTYYDCTVDDARLTLETIISGFNHGGVPLSYVKFEKAVEQNGKFTGGNVSDCLHRKNFEIKARCIVNATGPWTDATMSFFGGTDRPYLRPTQGSHLTVPSEKLHVNHAVVMNHPQDKRIMFAIPWGSHTIIGTTDTDYNQDLDQIYCTRKDVAYLLEALWHYFPDNKITEKDITGTWSGLRPLINQDTEKESDISREQKIWIDRRGLATIAGGKLTTYRLMAKELLDTALPQILPDASHGFTATEKEELPYAKNLPENIEQFDDYAAGLVRDRIISHEIVMRLLKDYGISASEIMRMMAESPDLANAVVENLPYVWADLEYSVKNEMCLTLADFMIRRTSIFYRMKDGGLAVIDRIVEKMTKLLGWDDARKQKEIEEYKSIVLKSRSAISS
jgi:glycerol-3-phosphate dehydrogenase